MTPNEQTIHRFYDAFSRLDYAAMQSCYHPEAVFNDPVFGLLDAEEVKTMWEMLCKRARNFSVQYGEIQLLDEEYTTTRWTASYDFAQTGRRVVNKVTAYMRFRDGLISEHTDAFNLYIWSQQALGITGWLFGWTNFFQRRLRSKALASLHAYRKQ
ncbi:nuclear transport factor 2 family protein [Sediminibacterium soli]|uniref:nuclear transport factor 2 family protein n=1 Tax=Sediminibacterium soli TaxID=2698829 RepID=UPI0013797199|nr:nuclear transport factor 2 family protein [Sediminibacterium soli]NCI47898.1 nuclear transport factor 2 family protein [Sediminibacterium soli]